MADAIRVMVEIGKKKRSAAAAFDWPSWDRTSELDDRDMDRTEHVER